jgi:hypothetical protein
MGRDVTLGRGEGANDDQIGRSLVEEVLRDDENGPSPGLFMAAYGG